MCDLPHTSGVAGRDAGISDENPKIGTIIRKYFPQDGALRRELIKAWSARQLLRQGAVSVSAYSPEFRARACERLSRQISVAKQRNGGVLTD